MAKHDEDDLPGWWDIMVGPNKPIDTNKYFAFVQMFWETAEELPVQIQLIQNKSILCK